MTRSDRSPRMPVDEVLPRVREALRDQGRAILIAPPGAGKTTRVPLALLEEHWAGAARIVVLEPRRLAARAAAAHMASLVGDRSVGGVVGLRTRGDTRVSDRTRIEIVTEGVLTRMLQTDPSLDGVACVVFDEFHERSLPADLGLALALHARSVLRPDLRLLVMSATLDPGPLVDLLEGAPVVRSEGRRFEVETRFRPPSRRDPTPWGIARDAADAVVSAMEADSGDVLVFLPGAGEIRRTHDLLDEAGLPEDVAVVPLHGRLARARQDEAIRPSVSRRRKVVLSTAIAETSITIDGIRIVVDAGWMRVPRFDPGSGFTRLATVRVTRDAADQRRGRAGRTGPGVCWRLWSPDEDRGLVAARTPQIAEADLAPVVLDLAAFGARAEELRWLDLPPEAARSQAEGLLVALELLTDEGSITESGRRVADLGVHPRIGRMLIEGERWGALEAAARLAALLTEGDPLRGDRRAPPVDVSWRLDALGERRGRGSGRGAGLRIDERVLSAARREVDRLLSRMRTHSNSSSVHEGAARGTSPEAVVHDPTGCLAAVAYPDRVGLKREGRHGQFITSGGRGVRVFDDDPMAREEAIVALRLDGGGQNARLFLAAALDRSSLEVLFPERIASVQEIGWDSRNKRVVAVEERRFGALVLRRAAWAEAPRHLVSRALCEGIRTEGLTLLPWRRDDIGLRDRLRFLHGVDPSSWPSFDDEVLLAELEDWLGPFLDGMRRVEDLRRLDLTAALGHRAGWENMRRIDELAPARLEVPSGSRIAIDYSDPSAPVLPVRIQEVFGWTDTPRIARDVPLTLHLLSPASRPVQVTRDLRSFWADAYFDVRRDLRGRYPKHAWPEDPLAATALRGVPRRKG